MLQLGWTTPDEDTGATSVGRPWRVAAPGAKMASMSGASAEVPRRASHDADDDELFTGLVVSDPQQAPRSVVLPASMVGPRRRDRAAGPGADPLAGRPPPEHPTTSARSSTTRRRRRRRRCPRASALVEKQEPRQAGDAGARCPRRPSSRRRDRAGGEAAEARAPRPRDRAGGQRDGQRHRRARGHGGRRRGRRGRRRARRRASAACIGGTGDGPVMDYDQPPRAHQADQAAVYPQEAFVKKIEGVVEVGDPHRRRRPRGQRPGHPTPCRCSTRPPSQTVKQWVFPPAIKGGRPVATIATRPGHLPDLLIVRTAAPGCVV